jgi:hypothetical protein
MSTNGQRLVALGYVNLQKRANGVILSSSANNIELNGITFRGDASSPTFTGDNVSLTGASPRIINCGSMWAYGRALKATGNNVVIQGSNPIWQTTDATGTGYDIELGVSGTATLYQQLVGIYTSQATGGILLTDTGSAMISGGQFGKLNIAAGTSPAGVNGGTVTGSRILGTVSVGLSNAVFTGNQFSSITMTLAAGTSGCTYVGNLESSGFSLVNNGTANQFLLRHDTAGTGGRITYQFGASSSLGKLEVDPSSGDWAILNGHVKLDAGKSLKFGSENKKLNSSSTNLQLTNNEGALQLTSSSLVQLIAGAGSTIYSFDADSLNLPSGTVIELGHASDTTIARVSAGDISVEGNLIYRANGALAASGGSALVGFLQSGTSATARTVQAKLRDIINVKDFGATGDGTTDDAAAIRAAITAASGRTLYFPTPAASYLCNSSLGTLSSVRLLGDGRRVCTIKKNYSGGSPFITMNDSSEIEGLRIDLAGNTGITGLGLYIANSQGNQRIAATQLLNGDTSCLYFQKDGGSNFTAYDLQAYCFTASNPAVEIEDVSTGGCPRSFVNFSSGGNKSFKLGGANNLFVSNSPIFDVDFSANNYDVCFANCRMAGSSGYTVRGSGSIMGGGIGPAMTIASGAAWNINPAYTNSTITDNSGGTSIIHQHNIVSYTPVWTAGGSAVTLGTGGSIVGRYSRSGKLVTAKFRILPGTGPTIPAGKWEITLPVPTAADLPQAAGTGKYTTGGGAFYRIDGYIPAAGTAVTLERDTSGEITGTSPSATGNGAGVWFQVTYET